MVPQSQKQFQEVIYDSNIDEAPASSHSPPASSAKADSRKLRTVAEGLFHAH
jgi:hypothetical protein